MIDVSSLNSIVNIFTGGYEDFSALYPFLRTQKIIYMPRVSKAVFKTFRTIK